MTTRMTLTGVGTREYVTRAATVDITKNLSVCSTTVKANLFMSSNRHPALWPSLVSVQQRIFNDIKKNDTNGCTGDDEGAAQKMMAR